MNLLQQIEKGELKEIDPEELRDLADSHGKLLRSAKRVNIAMSKNQAYSKVAFTMRAAIERAERLIGTVSIEEAENGT